MKKEEPIKILQDTALHKTGLLVVVKDLLRDFVKKGLPKGNIYEYAAKKMIKAGKKYKAKMKKL